MLRIVDKQKQEADIPVSLEYGEGFGGTEIELIIGGDRVLLLHERGATLYRKRLEQNIRKGKVFWEKGD